MHGFEKPKIVMVTGGGGHLGGKTVEFLAATEWCERVVCVVRGRRPELSETARRKTTVVTADLVKPTPALDAAMRGVDAVVHYAASNPVPDSTWDESLDSFDMTQTVGFAALDHGVRRLVFCSSNHAVGQYKDAPLGDAMGPGRLRTDLASGPGTRWANGDKLTDSTPYGASKVVGERFVARLAERSGGRLTGVSIRVGWALAGANRASDVSISGSPSDEAADRDLDAEDRRTLRWFRNMWLSNADLERVVLASVTADPSNWPAPAVIVNAVSANEGMDWSLEEGRRFLGYEPEDDAHAEIGRPSAA